MMARLRSWLVDLVKARKRRGPIRGAGPRAANGQVENDVHFDLLSAQTWSQRAQPGHQQETVRLQSAIARQRGVSSSTVSSRPYTLPSPPRTST